MAVFLAASTVATAAVEAMSLVWMELAMFGLAAIFYLAFIGIPGFSAAGGGSPKVKGGLRKTPSGLESGKLSPRSPRNVLESWNKTKGAASAAPPDLAAVVHALRQAGRSPAAIVEELRAAVAANEALLPALGALPAALLRDDAVELLDAALELLEGLGQPAEASIYAGLMAAQLRRRNFARVAAVGGRVKEEALTPRMLAMLASAAAQRGALDEALAQVARRPAAEGSSPPLAAAVALQILALAAKEQRVGAAIKELQLAGAAVEDQQFQDFVAAQGRRLQPEALDALLEGAAALGVGAEAGRIAVARAKAQAGQGGQGRAAAGGGEQQRLAGAIRSYAKEKNLEAAAALFEQHRGGGAALSPTVWNCFLDACVQCGDLERATAQFEVMKAAEVLDTVGFNTMLKALLQHGRTVEARDLVKAMKDRGLAANKVTYNELLHAKVLARDRPAIWAVVEEMQAAGVQPNPITCSILLKSLAGGGRAADLKRVIDLVMQVEEPVDEALFAAAVEVCVRSQQLDLLAGLQAHLKQQGTSPKLSAPTYGAMIKAFGQAGEVRRVLELWAEMREQRVKPTSITLGCLTEALVVNSKAQEAWDLVKEQMQHEETRPHINTVIYSTVLKGFAVTKNMEKTFAVYDEMRAHGIPCNTITYNTILDACAKCCAMARASKLLEDMAATCVEPDIITYSTILKGYCVEGDLDRAFHILEEMKKDGKLQPDEIMYNSILDGCAKQHRTDDALRILEEMKANGIVPSNFTLSIMVKVLGHARRLAQAFEVVEELSKKHGFRPNVQVYTCLVQACVNNRRLDRALVVHDMMVADAGCRADDRFYAALVKGCLQLRQPLRAVEVARAAYQLPGCTRSGGRAVGVEARALQELLAKLAAGGREEQQAGSQLTAELQRAGVRLPGGREGPRPGEGGRQR